MPLFVTPGNGDAGQVIRRRVSVGTWLVRRIGMFLNDQFKSYFPAGINVNFARVESARNTVEYRCFERGIFRETLACGTGAVACAVTARHLGKVGPECVTVLPHLCRWHDTGAVMQVLEESDETWSLRGFPRRLIEGNFIVDDSQIGKGANDFGTDTMEMLKLENQLLSRPKSAA